MEFNLITCEFEGEGINIVATIKKMGKPVMKFNCKTKYMDTALAGVEDILRKINLDKPIKLCGYEPELITLIIGKEQSK